MAWYDNMMKTLAYTIAGYITSDDKASRRRDYYTGDHPEQLKVKNGAYNDNVTMNYLGLTIARDVSRLFKGGITFNLPDGSTKQSDYLTTVWDTNKQEQLLYQLGLNGAVYGTPYVKIVPDGIINKLTDVVVPRLIALDPEITRVETDKFDVDEPERYLIEFTIDETSYLEVTRKIKADDLPGAPEAPGTWMVEHFIMPKGKSKWEIDTKQPPYEWPYDFPPIIHWKNLPSLKAHLGCYGQTDAEWAAGIQDKLNFADSNINKTIRLMAAPPTIATGVRKEPEFGTGPGSFTWFSEPDAKVFNLQANADITGSRAWSGDLQSAIFQLSREVPPAVVQQLGSGLTNFVMRVIWADALDKTDTKRELYGDAILEINRRLLVLAGYKGPASDPGLIVWGDPLPVNPVEKMAEDKFLLDNKLASKETIAKHYDIDYQAEKSIIDTEEAGSTNNIGTFLVNQFNKGQ